MSRLALVVGTPRSGTTLVQRLVGELDDVAATPETHVLDRFLPNVLARRTFPLAGRDLDTELRRYTALPTSRGLPVDPAAVADALGGRCRRPIDLFLAVARSVAPRPAPVLSEKTPEHLRWWRPVAAALPDVRLVAVVRHPVAVAASHARVPWGIGDPVVLAEQWVLDQAQVLAAHRTLGDGRVLVVRYEDVVADPDAARRRLGSFLGAPPSDGTVGEPCSLVHEWEWWKRRATAPLTTERVAAWRDDVPAEAAADVLARCRSSMLELGYDDVPGEEEAQARLASWPQHVEDRRRAHRRRKERRQAVIDRTVL